MSSVEAILQHMVDGFAADVQAVQVALIDGSTPEPGRRVLAGALRYVVERFDLYPDHLKGLGIVDDAAIIRLAAKQAVSYGCEQPDTRRLASEAGDLVVVFGDLLASLEEYVARLPWQVLQGKTAIEVLEDNE